MNLWRFITYLIITTEVRNIYLVPAVMLLKLPLSCAGYLYISELQSTVYGDS